MLATDLTQPGRARGDREGTSKPPGTVIGSPPRPWGPRILPRREIAAQRFTPTPVGTALRWECWPHSCSVHPHARGDRLGVRLACDQHYGSPPRPWGPPSSAGCPMRLGRFTPTPVGTAPSACRSARRRAVHPHARGDRGRTDGWTVPVVGSPPRPWGPLWPDVVKTGSSRFTPTPVGTAATRSAMREEVAVHPHARGDRRFRRMRALNACGSPPRPWGPRLEQAEYLRSYRFTPTPVGTAIWLKASAGTMSVHPHARGDRGWDCSGYTYWLGSPPRPWGPPAVPSRTAGVARFTPTPVGTARPGATRQTPYPVHPHARGDRVPRGCSA